MFDRVSPRPYAHPVARGKKPPTTPRPAPEPARIGRPSKLTDELRDSLCHALANGVYLAHAAPALGVDRRTITEWIRRGTADIAAGRNDTDHAALVLALETARERGTMLMTEIVTRAARRDWRAAAWWLERTRPAAFGATTESISRDEAHLADAAADGVAGEDEDLGGLNDGELELLDKSLERAEKLLSIGASRRAEG